MSQIKNVFIYFSFSTYCFIHTILNALALEDNEHEVSHATHEHHEVGIRQILIESDLLNVLIVAGALIYLGNKFLPKLLEQRKEQISKELESAKKARSQAEKELKTVREKCKNISNEIDQIKLDAKNTASSIQKRIEDETDNELEKVRVKVKREIDSAQDKAIQNIKKEASDAAIKLAEETLIKIAENPDVQQKLIDDFLDELDRPSNN